MKTYSWLFAVLVLVYLGSLWSCKPKPIIPDEGKMKIEIKHVAGDESLILNTGVYKTALDEKIWVDMLKYYLSNFELTKADGSVYTIPKDSCYFLIDASKANSQIFSLLHLPKGEYTALTFMIGVDSAKNYAPVEEHVGALDLANTMFWDWNEGHVFFKMEGGSPSLNGDGYRYHIAGAGGKPGVPTVNNLKKVTIPFGQNVSIANDLAPEVHLKSDILKVFSSRRLISVMEYTNVQSLNIQSTTIADNYASLFSLDLIH